MERGGAPPRLVTRLVSLTVNTRNNQTTIVNIYLQCLHHTTPHHLNQITLSSSQASYFLKALYGEWWMVRIFCNNKYFSVHHPQTSMKTLKITYNIHLYGPILCKEITLQLTNQFQVFRQKTFIIDDHLLIFTGPIQFSFRGFFLIYQIFSNTIIFFRLFWDP